MNSHTELVVEANPTKSQRLLRNLVILLCFTWVMMALLVNWMFFVVAIAMMSLLYRVLLQTNTEYEYILTPEGFRIDAIFLHAYRKKMVAVTADQVELLAQIDHNEVAAYDGEPLKNFAGNTERTWLYVMVCTRMGKTKRVLLRMDEHMLKSMRSWVPGKYK